VLVIVAVVCILFVIKHVVQGYGLLKRTFHRSIHQFATLKPNQATAKRPMVGTLHCFTQPCISVRLVKVASVLACHLSEQTSLTMKIPLSPTNSPASSTGSPLGSPLEVSWG
jgi:hypothetical protein